MWVDTNRWYTDDGDDATPNFDAGATEEEMQTPIQWVTYFGAVTYAEYYQRDLPTEAEWMMAADDGDWDDDNQNWWCGMTGVDGGVWCGGDKTGPRSYYVEETDIGTNFGTTGSYQIPRDELTNAMKDMRGNLR